MNFVENNVNTKRTLSKSTNNVITTRKNANTSTNNLITNPTNNLEKKNFEPFIDKKIIGNNFNIEKIIEKLPLIPSIYFEESGTIGSLIINSYFNIRNMMERLEIIKIFIYSILQVSGKSEFEKKYISKEKYKLNSNNLIIKFNDIYSTFKNQDDFKIFVQEYEKQKFNIFKSFSLDIPYFFQIFQVEYNGIHKAFFINLFKEYIDLRRDLFKSIKENYGLLSFGPVFDLSDNIDFSMLKNSLNKKDNNNTNNYSNYILYGNTPEINMTNNIKINISKKIRKFDYLYVNKYDNAYYKTKHQENISKYYNELKKSVNNLVGPNAEPNLYSILLNSFEVDFNTIKFVFNYVDPVIFGLAIDNNILIKQYISKKINNFEIYYDQYMYWYKQFIKPDDKSGSVKINKSDFKQFYEYILKELMSNDGNGNNGNNGNDNKGKASKGNDINNIKKKLSITDLELHLIKILPDNYNLNGINNLNTIKTSNLSKEELVDIKEKVRTFLQLSKDEKNEYSNKLETELNELQEELKKLQEESN